MTRVSLSLFILTLCAVTSGCNFLVPSDSYLGNRFRDLTEAANIQTHSGSVGGLVNVGPVIVGYHQVVWLAYGEKNLFGLGGMTRRKIANEPAAAGLLVPFSYQQEVLEDGSFEGKPLDDYASQQPTWGSVGVDLGALGVVGFGARLDFVELADFLTGLFGYDLLGDDLRPEEASEPQSDSQNESESEHESESENEASPENEAGSVESTRETPGGDA
ncbi:MAG: hypothetical protein AAF517_06400 [Planctomycetota bacterium]